MTTVAEQAHLERVLAVECVVCDHVALFQNGRTYAHHMKLGAGTSQRNSGWLTIALCYEHHQGKTGWHGLGRRGFYTRYRLEEIDLLEATLKAVYGKRS